MYNRKQETFKIDGMNITVIARMKTSVGNHAGFSVKIKGTDHDYHVNVLEIDDAINRGLHKFLQRELGLDDMVTYMNVEGITLCIKARDGKFLMSNQAGEFSVSETTDQSLKDCGVRTWDITHADYAEKICSVCKAKGEEHYTAIGIETAKIGKDLYIATARFINEAI